MNKSLPPLIRHVLYNLRGGFLVRPLIITLALGTAGVSLAALEHAFPALSAWVPQGLSPSRADPQAAQAVLSTVATSMMTVVSIVFAILLMTLTLASMQYSPRILTAFAQDRVTQETLGVFLGTFTYCLAVLPSVRLMPRPTAPVLAILGAMLLALACVAWLLFFIHHISQAIGVNSIVDRIACETEAVIDETMARPRQHGRFPDPPPPEPDLREMAVLSVTSGYIRFIDMPRLVRLARSYGVVVRIHRRVGYFVPAGVPLLTVSKREKMSPRRCTDLCGTFDFGPTRTLEQDVEFGILQIVDIALKAISPAVNDPSTAITCVDQLSRVLIRFAGRDPLEALLYDPPGIVRVIVPRLGLDRLLDSAFEQIRLYAKSDVAVSLRMLRALGDIATTVPGAPERQALAERGQRIVSGCAEQLGEEELGEMRARLATLERLAEDAGAAQSEGMPLPIPVP